MADVSEQVAAIKPGDTVTARFNSPTFGEFTVTGKATNDGDRTMIAGHTIIYTSGEPGANIAAIESHEPAKPDLPSEPQGDYLLREPSGQVSIPSQPGVLMRQYDGARLYWDTLFRYHGADLKVYRPEPTAQHEAVTISEFAEVMASDAADWDEDTCREMVHEFLTNLRNEPHG